MPRRLPDVTKIHQVIGYKPTLNLIEMLEWIIAYARQQLEVRVAP